MKNPDRNRRDSSSLPEVVIALPDAMRERLRRRAEAEPRPRSASSETVQRIVQARREEPGALLPILHDVQDALGHVPADAVAEIAEGLNLSRAEVHGVLTYYHHFRSEPAGRHVLQVCRAEACQAVGAEALWRHACERLDLPQGGTRSDGAATLEAVYCLGLCSASPAAVLDGRLHARLTPQRLDAVLAPVVQGAARAEEVTA